jgi:signal transduction histidine kinase
MEPLAAERQQRLIVATAASGVVYGNEDELIRMLLNLFDNAIRYTPIGGCITLSCEQRNGDFHLTMQDTGPGIAPQHVAHVFDRFYRVDTGRSRTQGGSGLGLAIAQSIAQIHGGQITVESVVDQGSTFTIRLPASGTASRQIYPFPASVMHQQMA